MNYSPQPSAISLPSRQTCLYLIYWLCPPVFRGNHYPGRPACFHCAPFGTIPNDPLRHCFSAFFPPFLDVTRRSVLLAKGNHWRLGTQAETLVLYNWPEMRSCGGARGSKLTTNIITVGAVEEVGERAGGGRGVYPTQASNWVFFCMFVLWRFPLRRLFTLPASQPGCNWPPLSEGIVGVSASVWDTRKERTQLSLLSCAHVSHRLTSNEFMLPLASRARGPTFPFDKSNMSADRRAVRVSSAGRLGVHYLAQGHLYCS